MPRYVAFLRGINLGKRRLSMSTLASIFEKIGHAEVATFIASGNVIFTSRSRNSSALEARASAELETALGYGVDVFVRTLEAVATIAGSKPFPQDGRDRIIVHVGFLHQELPTEIARKLEAVRTPTDELRVSGREYYWLCRTLTSQSKFWTLPEVRALRLPTSTMRNMTSIRKLVGRHFGTEFSATGAKSGGQEAK
jgi:uncharacterized protein (DUF1697 family)